MDAPDLLYPSRYLKNGKKKIKTARDQTKAKQSGDKFSNLEKKYLKLTEDIERVEHIVGMEIGAGMMRRIVGAGQALPPLVHHGVCVDQTQCHLSLSPHSLPSMLGTKRRDKRDN
jgi:hypothetical protein